MNPPPLPASGPAAAAAPEHGVFERPAAESGRFSGQSGGLRRRRRWPWVLLVLGIVLAGGIAWAILRAPDDRPLTTQQLAEFESKLAAVEGAGAAGNLLPAPPSSAPPAEVSGTFSAADQRQDEAAPYQPGAKQIVFTEREINHLLRERLHWGDTVRVALREGAIAVYADVPIDEQAPLLGGHTLRLRSRVFAGEERGQPVLRLDDVTLWGVSLPNAWLGQLKGQNLLAGAGASGATGDAAALAQGIQRLSIHAGRIEIDLAD